MRFDSPLIAGELQRRYQRFLGEVILDSGEKIIAYIPNTGSLKGCLSPKARVGLTVNDDPGRKYPHTIQLIQDHSTWVGINTQWANALVSEAIKKQIIPDLTGYDDMLAEQPYGSENSRIDWVLRHSQRSDCYIEVKNVTASLEKRQSNFPDAVTLRGQKHLRELMRLIPDGDRAVLFFCIQRDDVDCWAPADNIDPRYCELLRQAVAMGVEVLAYRSEVNEWGVTIKDRIPVII